MSTFGLINGISGNAKNPQNESSLFCARIVDEQAIPEPPRFREAYLAWNEERTQPVIVIRSRSGGGNRDDYRSENAAMSAHPLCLSDVDDEFDCTYALFTFRVPDDNVKEAVGLLNAEGETPSFQERFNKAIETIRSTKL